MTGRRAVRPSRGTFLALLTALALLLAAPASAQESLSSILDREYVAHWLVCGPFTPDAEGGLMAAVAAGRAPLGDKDFMEPRGGVTKLRPQHLDLIETPQGDAVWQRAGAKDFTLDLSPFYPSAREGITYIGFYARSDAPRTIYIDLQTPLGARVWLNGYLLRDVRPVPLSAAGRDQFLAPFRAGENFFLIEAPGAAFEELATALGMTERELSARGLVSRPLLQGRSGFEIALRARPAQPMGTEVAVVPKLAPEGTYSGQASSPRQDYALTVYNNAGAATLPLSATLRYPGADLPLYATIGPVPGKAARDTRISIPVGQISEGEGLALEVTVTDGTLTSTFTQTITREAAAEPGKLYVLTGPHYLAADPAWPPEAAWIEGFNRQALQAGNEAAYGFLLGPQAVWEAALLAHPELFSAVREYVQPGQCAAEAAYAPADPRWLSPELLYRNIALGRAATKTVLDDAAPASIPWLPGGLPAQWPQLARIFGLPGAITGIDTHGFPALAQWIGPDGTPMWLRRKEPARGPLGLTELRQMVALQRRELLAQGFKSDVLVDQAATTPPEPFLPGQAQELARSVPAILLRGGGAQDFFDELRASEDEALAAVPRTAWPMDNAAPARVRGADALWLAHFRAQAMLDSAQRLASFASLYGMDYPARDLAQCERALLYLAAYAAPGANEDAHADALSETRQAAALAASAIGAATAALALDTDTLSTAPLETEGARAVVVFNPASWTRTDRCTLEIALPARGAYRLLDTEGTEVPMETSAPRNVDAKTRVVNIAFVAKDVPGIGHSTFYLVPAPGLPKAEQRPDLLIDNEYFEVGLDRGTGDIDRIIDKESGEPLLTGPGNVFASITEREAKRRNPEGLWTEGTPERPAGTPEFRTTVTPALQEITVRQAFLGGHLVRAVRLYKGLRRVDFETHTENTSGAGLVTTSFSMGTPQQVSVSGAPFGAGVRAASETDLAYRSDEAAGLAPALYWAARTPGDQVQIGTEGGIPFLPAEIVHGDAPVLRSAANTLAAALARRGIPATVQAGLIQKPDFLWSDSTGFETHEEAWKYGARMRFVIGSPEQNPFCSEVVKAQAPETIKWLADRAPQGVVAYVDDTRGEGSPKAPTFLLIGPTASRSAGLVAPIAKEIDTRGAFTLPASSFVPDNVPVSPTRGAVLVFEGSANTATDAGGATVLVLAQGAVGAGIAQHATWRYAFVPLDGAWTSGDAARAGHAFNAPFAAAATALHGGRLPARATYLSLDAPAAVLASLRPANDGAPRDGLVLRAYNPGPGIRAGSLRGLLPPRQAALATPEDLPGDALTITSGAAAVELPGFGIQSWWVLPGAPPARLDPTQPAAKPVLARAPFLEKYWLQRTAPPFAAAPQIALALQGPLDESVASVRLRVGAIAATTDVEAIVKLTASEGLTISPAQMYVHLAPGESQEREIALLWNGPAQPGSGIAATIDFGGETSRDLIEYQPAPFKVDVSRTGGQIRVRVTNPNALAAEGFVDCITPPAHWPELGQGNAPRLSPRRQAISVPSYETIETNFVLSDPEATVPMRVKAAINGHVTYADVPDASPTPTPAPAAAPRPTGPGTPAPPPPRATAPPIERAPA